jgi:uncharacterized NAD(P)/FAD-binding protein YdhS
MAQGGAMRGRKQRLEPSEEQIIVIIGGGFSGTMVAVHAGRLAGPGTARFVLIEKGPHFARGLAYSTRCQRHLLNVPAAKMSALGSDPSHFLEWLKLRQPSAEAATFAPRSMYGDYLEDLLAQAVRDAAVPIELVQDEAVGLRDGRDGGKVLVRTATGRLIIADTVVLALGNQPPRDPLGVDNLAARGRYAGDPWMPSLLEGLGPDEPIALVGSGLTAVDIVVEADERGHRGTIYAISRHGLLPCRHRTGAHQPHFELTGEQTTARALLKSVRTEAAKRQAEGGDWRSVVDGMRPVTQSLWRSLENNERKRFVRHLASHWDVHRHRVAPEIDDLLQARLADNRLVLIAGRLLSVEERGDGLVIGYRRRGDSQNQTLSVRRVINCTGPARDIRLSPSLLLRSILANGLGRPGPLALGLDVTDTGAVIRKDGRVHERLFAIGSLLKDHLWETTAVPELRVQAAELASRILATS